MEVLVITGDRADVVPIAALPSALADPEAIVWVDVPDLDEEALGVLREVFGFHPVTIWECKQRQRMPKFHPYADHVFVVLHSPELGEHGHVHYVELDQFIAANYLVTVHGPTNPAVPVVTLPITALASVLGMNVIVNSRTQQVPLALSLGVMITMSAFLLRWAKRHGWW